MLHRPFMLLDLHERGGALGTAQAPNIIPRRAPEPEDEGLLYRSPRRDPEARRERKEQAIDYGLRSALEDRRRSVDPHEQFRTPESIPQLFEALTRDMVEPFRDFRERSSATFQRLHDRLEKVEELYGSVDRGMTALQEDRERTVAETYDRPEAELTHKDVRGFEITRYVYGQIKGWPRHMRAEPTYKAARAAYIRAYEEERNYAPDGARLVTANLDDEMGALIPPEYLRSEMIEPLRAMTISLMLGARMITGLRGSEVTIGRRSGTPIATWSGERPKPVRSNTKSDLVRMRPRKLTAVSEVTMDFLEQTTEDANGMLRDDLVDSVALGLDLAHFKGTGAESQPVGAFNLTGISTVDWAGAEFGDADTIQTVTDKLDQMSQKLRGANVLRRSRKVVYVMGTETMTKLLSCKDRDGKPIFFVTINAGGRGREFTPGGEQRPDERFGASRLYPYGETTQLDDPNELALMGIDFSLIGMWGDMLVDTNDRALEYWDQELVGIKVRFKGDINFKYPEAICLAQNFPQS